MKHDDAIPLPWIKEQIDTLLVFADKAGPDSVMGKAAMLRADYYLDLVKAWKEHGNEGKGGE